MAKRRSSTGKDRESRPSKKAKIFSEETTAANCDGENDSLKNAAVDVLDLEEQAVGVVEEQAAEPGQGLEFEIDLPSGSSSSAV